ncbi:uncharacterized protein LOC121420623 [Lytechinus variegatus]|uniref:uncharacterized protein LOC121420623 n=1 Tax=Lytechinus variegatus TaxID=7654 RepID=UPI001BB21411|nr:uncharacterized protein LOC121420623 [Lytechinus variegatus]
MEPWTIKPYTPASSQKPMNLDPSVNTQLHYTREQLLSLRNTTMKPLEPVRKISKELGITRQKRGKRAGRRVHRPIKSWISYRKNQIRNIPLRSNANLRFVQRVVDTRCEKNYPSIMLTNVRSMNRKFDELCATISHYNADIIGVTETWFSDSNPASANAIQDFNLFHRDRTAQRGGGIALYARDDLEPETYELDLVPPHLEIIWIKVNLHAYGRGNVVLFVCVVYSPPRTQHHDDYYQPSDHYGDHIRTTHPDSSIMIMGDFNDLQVEEFVTHLSLSQMVKQPTRNDRILDMIFTDHPEHYSEPVIKAPIATSDHATVLMIGSSQLSSSNVIKSFGRPLRDSNIRSFGRWIINYNFDWLQSIDTADEMVDAFQDVLTQAEAYYEHFPIVISRRKSSDKPWITHRIKDLISKRQRAYDSGNGEMFRKVRNLVQRDRSKCKELFYVRRVQDLRKSEPSQWHRQIRSMAGVSKASLKLPTCFGHNDSQKAARVNEHFAGVCSQLPSLNLGSLPSYLPSSSRPPTIYAHEVFNILRNLDASKAIMTGDIPIKLIKEFALELAEPLSNIFNVILRTGSYPSCWKRAVITPIPKKQQVSQLSDLRPISITAVFSRVLETFISKWISRDLSPVIDKKQFGNVTGSSTTHYLISLLDSIGKSFDKPGHCASLCAIDFSKAFDHVNHNIVVRKLIDYGVKPALVPVICGFLDGRKQAVKVGSSISCDLGVTCGVPQGTKLGPVLFLTMINDAMSDCYNRWKYVDSLVWPKFVV